MLFTFMLRIKELTFEKLLVKKTKIKTFRCCVDRQKRLSFDKQLAECKRFWNLFGIFFLFSLNRNRKKTHDFIYFALDFNYISKSKTSSLQVVKLYNCNY